MKAKDGKRTASLSGSTSLVTGARGVISIPRAKRGKIAENVAIIAYSVRQTVTMDGKQQELRAADGSTWIRDADGWRCHTHSGTFLK